MTEHEARAILQDEVTRVSLNVVYQRAGLSAHTILSRWLAGGSLKGTNREKLLNYAESLRTKTPSNAREGTVPLPADILPPPQEHPHLIALHEEATSEQRIWIARLILRTLKANIRDLEGVLQIPSQGSTDGPPAKPEPPPTTPKPTPAKPLPADEEILKALEENDPRRREAGRLAPVRRRRGAR